MQVLAAFMVTEPSAQSASPPQLMKVESAEGVAEIETTVPELYVPAPVTVPDPVPDVLIVRR